MLILSSEAPFLLSSDETQSEKHWQHKVNAILHVCYGQE